MSFCFLQMPLQLYQVSSLLLKKQHFVVRATILAPINPCLYRPGVHYCLFLANLSHFCHTLELVLVSQHLSNALHCWQNKPNQCPFKCTVSLSIQHTYPKSHKKSPTQEVLPAGILLCPTGKTVFFRLFSSFLTYLRGC